MLHANVLVTNTSDATAADDAKINIWRVSVRVLLAVRLSVSLLVRLSVCLSVDSDDSVCLSLIWSCHISTVSISFTCHYCAWPQLRPSAQQTLTLYRHSCQLVTLCHPGLTYIFNFWHSGTLVLSPERQTAQTIRCCLFYCPVPWVATQSSRARTLRRDWLQQLRLMNNHCHVQHYANDAGRVV